MFDKLKSLFNTGYKPYNMVICANKLHKKICNCSCHTTKNMSHMTACCHIEKCPDCKKELRIKNSE